MGIGSDEPDVVLVVVAMANQACLLSSDIPRLSPGSARALNEYQSRNGEELEFLEIRDYKNIIHYIRQNGPMTAEGEEWTCLHIHLLSNLRRRSFGVAYDVSVSVLNCGKILRASREEKHSPTNPQRITPT